MKARYKLHTMLITSILISLITSCGQPLATRMGMSEDAWNSLTSIERSEHYAQYELAEKLRRGTIPPAYPHRRALSVQITSGTAKMLPSFTLQAFQPATMVIEQDSCQHVTLKAKVGDDTTTLSACFFGHEFWLDPSPTNVDMANYSVRLFESSLWRKFTYNHIDTRGYVGLNNANIAVKLLDNS